MVKPKNIIVAGSAGFILSFLISIISTRSFGHSLLRGLIFGAVFAGLDVGISFLKDKFLDLNESSSLSDSPAPASNSGLGSKVDITLSDDNLTDDGEGLHFAVGNNKRSIEVPAAKADSTVQDAGENMSKIPAAGGGNTYVPPSQPVPDEPAAEAPSSFKPVQLGTQTMSAGNDSESPVIKAHAAENSEPDAVSSRKAQAKAEREADIKEVDELPDIGGFVPEIKADADDGVIEDSDFAETGDSDMSFARESSPAASAAGDHDAETMSKAIRTLLHKDD